jgi:hypothetical protein
MRHVIAFCEFEADEWAKCTTGRPGLPLDLLDGVRAYATRQAAIQHDRVSSLRVLFSSALDGDNSAVAGTSRNGNLPSPSGACPDDDSDEDSCGSDFNDDI